MRESQSRTEYAAFSSSELAEFRGKEDLIVMLLIGATEQHGPHLPVGVDSEIGWAIIQGTIDLLKGEIPLLILPRMDFGKSIEHMGFPGTISLSTATLQMILRDITTSLAASGFRKFVMLSSHGGHNDVISGVATDCHASFPTLRVFPLYLWDLKDVLPPSLSPMERRFGIHAGQIETSLMLFLRENCVQMEKAICELPPHANFCDSGLAAEWKFSWTTTELSRSGVIGDATSATRATGEWIYKALTTALASYLREVSRFVLPRQNQ